MSRTVFAMFFLISTTVAQIASADLWVGGHGDIGVALNGNALELHFHFENDVSKAGGGVIPAGEYAPGDVQVFVPGPSIARPAGAQWDFLGAPTDQVWFLPATTDANKPYLGWGLEELDSADWNGPLTWSLTSVVSAPSGGNFSLWKEEFGAPVAFMSTANGVSSSDAFQQSAGLHEHFFLGFTREGIYQLELSILGNNKTLGTLTDTAVFTFAVGVPEPSSIALLGVASVGLVGRVLQRRRNKSA